MCSLSRCHDLRSVELLPLALYAEMKRSRPQRGAGVLRVITMDERWRAFELIERLLDAGDLIIHEKWWWW